MNKVLIVDDEHLFRKALRVKINWEEIGFVICGEAKNGEEAIEMVKIHKPEVAVVDINMPIMDGLSFIEEIRNKGINLEIIIVTGYSDFNYAKQAIQFGIRNYILKPVDEDELKRELMKIKCKIENEISINFRLDNLREQVKKSLPIVKEKFLNDLIYGKYFSDNEFEKRCNYLNINLKGLYYRILLVEVDNEVTYNWNDEDKALWTFAISNITQEILSKDCSVEICCDNNNKVCSIISSNCENQETFNFLTINHCEEIKESITMCLGFKVSIGLGNIYTRTEDIFCSYNESVFALRNKIIEGENKVLLFQDIGGDNFFVSVYSTEIRMKLLMSMKLMDIYEINCIIAGLFEEVKKRAMSYELLISICVELLSTCFELTAGTETSMKELFPKTGKLFEEMHLKKSLEDLKYWITDIVIKVSETTYSSKKSKDKQIILDIKDYVLQNYYDSDLNIEKIAEHFFMNYSYLSHMFKKETTMSLSEFLREVRIKKAKELMDRGEISIYDVSENVGYLDSNYFSRCFKKYYGITPTKYIETILSQ